MSPPIFRNISDALDWAIATGAPTATVTPPVDATGDEYVDAYLATVFEQLRHLPTLSDRIEHLNDRASVEDRQCMRVMSSAGEKGDPEFDAQMAAAAIHRGCCDTLRKWAQALHDAGAEVAARETVH